MRMIDRRMEIEAPAKRRQVSGLLVHVRNAAARFARAWQNRRAINRLSELDDHQLFDMGLCRSDIQDVRSAAFVADAGLHLTIVSRERARRHLRTGRMD